MSDEAVISTNDDATECKKSAVQLGYWPDTFIQYFTKTVQRRAPEINRGYFARVQSIRLLIKQFIQKTERKCQIINLGAGFDTNYWLLKDEKQNPSTFIEVDFPSVTMRKCYYVKSRKPLLGNISKESSDVQISENDLHSPDYHIIGVDLRNLDALDSKLTRCSVDAGLPTLILAECVLVYLSKLQSENLLKYFSSNFPTAMFINYEQVNMSDNFGRIMVENLEQRNCSLGGIEHCESLSSQEQRFLNTGWDSATALDMNHVYNSLPAAEIHRVERLEMLDEVELIQQLFHHYCVCTACKDPTNIGLSTIHF